MEDSATSTQSN